MKILSLAALVSGLVAVVSCSSTGPEEGGEGVSPASSAVALECICGTEQGLIYGCDCAACASGVGDPENVECLCAAPPSAGEDCYFHLRSGRSYKGIVLSDDGPVVTIETAGGNQRTFSRDELKPRTAYALMKARVGEDDFDGQLAIAGYALENERPGYALKHYRLAYRADPSRVDELEAEMSSLRRNASERVVRSSRQAFGRGDPGEATGHLIEVLWWFPGEPAAAKARRLLELQDEEVIAASTALRQGAPKSVVRKLEPARRHLERALESEIEATLGLDDHEQAIAELTAGIRSAVKSYELLTKVERTAGGRRELAGALAEMKVAVERVAIDCSLQIAFLHLLEREVEPALERIDAALKVEPDHRTALRFRQHAEALLAGKVDAWGWYPTGGPSWMWAGYGERAGEE